MKEEKVIKIGLKKLIIIVAIILILTLIVLGALVYNFNDLQKRNEAFALNKVNNEVSNDLKNALNETNSNDVNKTDNSKIETSEFDYLFLKLENEKENKIYSPLSIKYALKMLEEASNGKTKTQISNLIGNLNVKKYNSNKNFSFANSLFVRNDFKDEVKAKYIDLLKDKYAAEVKFDTFENAKNINNWISDKTLQIIPEIIKDEDVKELDFALINALAIDMEWQDHFFTINNDNKFGKTYFNHQKFKKLENEDWDTYWRKSIGVDNVEMVSENKFQNDGNELSISSMQIEATINNYDIIKDLGEENIKKTVSDEYRKFAKGEEYDTEHAYGDFALSDDTSDAGIQKDLDEFIPNYIKEIKENYHKIGSTTSFSVYTDNDVKVFAKDLKEYEGTTLQYIGIMPTTDNLTTFVDNIDVEKIDKYIKNLKNVEKYSDFEEGVVTKIYGYIPKFKFNYNLNLMEDLEKLKVTDVFDKEKADLSNMTEQKAYISKVIHQADIEFTQDGIKAAAVSLAGGEGAGAPFDYEFDVPVKFIDITFDKPYMFLIQDKETGEIWFTGTVYEPLAWEDDEGNPESPSYEYQY